MVFTTVPLSAFDIVAGKDSLRSFAMTSVSERQYCGDCGAPLTVHVAHHPDQIDIAVGSLDNVSSVSPGFHLYTSHAPEWLRLGDRLPTFEELRPVNRGPRRSEGPLPD